MLYSLYRALCRHACFTLNKFNIKKQHFNILLQTIAVHSMGFLFTHQTLFFFLIGW